MLTEIKDYVNKNPFYDPFRFKIELKFSEADLKDPLDGVRNYSILIHEYMHYIQNFGCTYGLGSALLTLETLKNFLFLMNNSEDPFGIRILHAIKDFKDSLNYAKSLLYFEIKEDSSNYLWEDDYFKYSVYQIKEDHITYVSHYKSKETSTNVALTPQVIRENMSTMAYYISKQVGEEGMEVDEDFNNLPSWYKCIYLMCRELIPPGHSYTKICYYLCELSLNTFNPTYFISKITHSLIYAFNHSSPADTTEDIFTRVLKEQYLKEAVYEGIKKITGIHTYLINWAKGTKNDNEVIDMFFKVLLKIESVLYYKWGNPTFLKGSLSSNWLTNYSRNFGSPLVVYTDKISVLGGDKDYAESLAYLTSIINFIYDYDELKFTKHCPYLKKFPICHDENRPESICENNFFDIISKESHCLMYNLLLIINYK